MLILSRKVDQKILIGDSIWITIIEIDGNKVRLGIDAPKDQAIIRPEAHTTTQGNAA
jgi:carbon storage regulator